MCYMQEEVVTSNWGARRGPDLRVDAWDGVLKDQKVIILHTHTMYWPLCQDLLSLVLTRILQFTICTL